MNEESSERAVDSSTVQLLWYGLLVYLDVQTTFMLTGTPTMAERRIVLLKSAVLVAVVFLVVRYS